MRSAYRAQPGESPAARARSHSGHSHYPPGRPGGGSRWLGALGPFSKLKIKPSSAPYLQLTLSKAGKPLLTGNKHLSGAVHPRCTSASLRSSDSTMWTLGQPAESKSSLPTRAPSCRTQPTCWGFPRLLSDASILWNASQRAVQAVTVTVMIYYRKEYRLRSAEYRRQSPLRVQSGQRSCASVSERQTHGILSTGDAHTRPGVQSFPRGPIT